MALFRCGVNELHGSLETLGVTEGKYLKYDSSGLGIGNLSDGYTNNGQGSVIFNTNGNYSTMTVSANNYFVGAGIKSDGTTVTISGTTMNLTDVIIVTGSWGTGTTSFSFT